MTETILETVDARGVATLTLNRPDRHNAFDDALIADLTAALRRLGDELAEQLVTERDFTSRSRSQIVAHAVVGMVQASGEWWLEHPEVSEEEIIDDLTDAVVGAIRQSES